MPVNTLHPEYIARAEQWVMVRDSLQGERAVKVRTTAYLPAPPGMDVADEALASGKRTKTTRYDFYLSFAEFPEIVGPSLNGFQGVIHGKEPTIRLPTGLEYLLEEATPDGLTLLELWFAVTAEILAGSRANLLRDVSEEDDNVRLVLYSVENMTNWQPRPRRVGGDAQWAVVREPMRVPSKEDAFKTDPVLFWRELRLLPSLTTIGTDTYHTRLWRSESSVTSGAGALSGSTQITSAAGSTSDPQLVLTKELFEQVERLELGPDAEIPPDFGFVEVTIQGKPYDHVPLTTINPLSTGFEYGPVPIMALVRRAMAIYRLSADYRRALYIKGDPQVVLTGVAEDEIPTEIGGETTWSFSNPDAKAAYLDIDGQGIPLMREAIQDEYIRYWEEGGKLLQAGESGPESGVALKRRQVAQQVSLRNIVVNAGNAMQDVLRALAEDMGENPDEVLFTPDLDFAEPTMSGQELLEYITAKAQGAGISHRSIHALMKRGGVTEMTFDEEVDEIETEPTFVTPEDEEGESSEEGDGGTFTTGENNGHTHTYTQGAAKTGETNGHTHGIDGNGQILDADGHSHAPDRAAKNKGSKGSETSKSPKPGKLPPEPK